MNQKKMLHGLSKLPEYAIWVAMKSRCLNEKDGRYKDYGGRGITVAPEWVSDFPAFLAHVGRRPSKLHTIERTDNARGYHPGNVRWASRVEQARNTRRSRFVTINGRTQCRSAWCEELGIQRGVVKNRIVDGWDPVRALTTPVIKQRDCAHLRPLALKLVAEGKTLMEAAAAVGVGFRTVSKWWRKDGRPRLPNPGRRNAPRDEDGRFA